MPAFFTAGSYPLLPSLYFAASVVQKRQKQARDKTTYLPESTGNADILTRRNRDDHTLRGSVIFNGTVEF
jgi:hypothetical protein